ncbi:MAG: ParB/RepB/Spo0J family partition protein [Candidatus Brennerbacteria bacterium]|nr:ParB/RepB/Spo0J family partition protein [Candidatus Brennerbacteria bacterium]
MLGKGLESLIPKKDNPPSDKGTDSQMARLGPSFDSEGEPPRTKSDRESIFHIEVEKIKPNPYQPRRDFNKEDLAELAQSIREFGIIQPLVVTRVEKDAPGGTEVEYQLVAGERRLMAAKLIGLPRVPAIVKRFDFHQAKLEVALIENIQRADLNPIEAARAYARLQDEFGLTQREIAAKIGKSRETVANTVRFLSLPSPIQEALSGGRINESQARLILAAEPSRQNELFEKFLSGRSVAKAKSEEAAKPADPEANYWAKRLEERFGAPVEIQRKEGKGKMIVKFHSEAEWQSILDKLIGEDSIG